MHLSAAPPQPVPIFSHFDYVAVDAERRRVYAAHTGSQALLIVNADSGAVVGQVDVGGHLQGVAVDVRTGMVYTGDGDADTVSQVDPKSMQVKASVTLSKPIDAIAFDPKYDKIYADEDSGNHVFVIDAAKMQLVGTVVTPGMIMNISPSTQRTAISTRTFQTSMNLSSSTPHRCALSRR